jgi:hypothetical protein
MLTQLPRRPPPPGSRGSGGAQDWRCSHCRELLGTIKGDALHILARESWLTADEAHARCPNSDCRSREHFPLRQLAA